MIGRKCLFGAVCAIPLLGVAMPASADRIDFNLDVIFGAPPVHEVRRVWVEPVYRTVCDRVWVEPVYEDRCERVWQEAVYEDRCEQVWVPDRFEFRTERGRDECGRRVDRQVRILIQAGHYETVTRRVCVREAGWVEMPRRVCVRDGHWQTIERQELVQAGHWKDVVVSDPGRCDTGGFDVVITDPRPRWGDDHDLGRRSRSDRDHDRGDDDRRDRMSNAYYQPDADDRDVRDRREDRQDRDDRQTMERNREYNRDRGERYRRG
jgi:hypothetical protein